MFKPLIQSGVFQPVGRLDARQIQTLVDTSLRISSCQASQAQLVRRRRTNRSLPPLPSKNKTKQQKHSNKNNGINSKFEIYRWARARGVAALIECRN